MSGIEESISAVALAGLEKSHTLGFFGPGPLSDQLDHAEVMVGAVERHRSHGHRVLDLGTGGGLPGLLAADRHSDWDLVLVDSARRRMEHVSQVVADCGWSDRVRVVCGRAETLARQPENRGQFGVVVARGLGRPATTLECAIGFLRPNGFVVVSDSPASPDERWPSDGIAEFNCEVVQVVRDPPAWRSLRLVGACDDRWPRRDGVPRKRPVF